MEIKRRVKIEGIVMDWAGTTVDFGCFAPVEAFAKAFRGYGLEPTLLEIREPMGMLKRDHVKTMLAMPRISAMFQEVHGRAYAESDVTAIYEKSESGILEIVSHFAEPKPYVLETVKALRDRGIKIGSTTGYTDEMMAIVTEQAKKAGYEPDAWYGPNSVGNAGRPYPYMIFQNMQRLHLRDVRTVLKVGDTVADIKEGLHAGVRTVGIVDGSSVMGLSEAEFQALTPEEYEAVSTEVKKRYKDAGADYVIAHMGELTALIDRMEQE